MKNSNSYLTFFLLGIMKQNSDKKVSLSDNELLQATGGSATTAFSEMARLGKKCKAITTQSDCEKDTDCKWETSGKDANTCVH